MLESVDLFKSFKIELPGVADEIILGLVLAQSLHDISERIPEMNAMEFSNNLGKYIKELRIGMKDQAESTKRGLDKLERSLKKIRFGEVGDIKHAV